MTDVYRWSSAVIIKPSKFTSCTEQKSSLSKVEVKQPLGGSSIGREAALAGEELPGYKGNL